MNGSYVGVSYVAPLRRAWARAERLLFRPFAIRTWLVLGFAAFLSEALSTGGGATPSHPEQDRETPSRQ